MTRNELAHVLRAAARIADDPRILVIGSQSILGSFDEEELPEVAWLSTEADLAFLDDPEAKKADSVDGAIGELSPFHPRVQLLRARSRGDDCRASGRLA